MNVRNYNYIFFLSIPTVSRNKKNNKKINLKKNRFLACDTLGDKPAAGFVDLCYNYLQVYKYIYVYIFFANFSVFMKKFLNLKKNVSENEILPSNFYVFL